MQVVVGVMVKMLPVQAVELVAVELVDLAQVAVPALQPHREQSTLAVVAVEQEIFLHQVLRAMVVQAQLS